MRMDYCVISDKNIFLRLLTQGANGTLLSYN